ncbi:MAG TPA: sulfatase [Phycisphaerae bacterium]|jgi:arylsulfatase A|nr:sulfatase [Phycisphaerae bacterium]HOJ56275.1 sulfatase [Phycisphaerae bacterium]HOL28133.1 sulfatase [Phycisphaerae bacterium]HPP19756.1 sulfatase [Phycisphaerae bacterium]HPU33808.1 sulfatase [Phycisphaerae bacterium]
MKPFFACAVSLCFALPAVTTAQETRRLPNFVIIFIDDMGYADIGPFGAKDYPTPHLDRLAWEGRRFTDFYASQPVCSASRASLMTGCYNVRIGILGALGPRVESGIHPEETTLAEICKQKGYATACYGKWHLGHHPKFLPTANGFDEYFGLPYSNDMWPFHPAVENLPMARRFDRWPHLPLMEGTAKDGVKIINPKVTAEEQKMLTTWYTRRAVSFIDRNKDRPFLLYVPHSMVHVPLHVSDQFAGKSKRGLFGDVVMEVDWSVGEILEAIRRNGLDKDTMVIFTSDNGPWLSYGSHAGSADPLREGKGATFEGGIRVPTLMWWPGQIPAGTVCNTPAMTIDILPTIAHLIGAKLPERKIDGKNIWPLIKGEPGAKSPQEAYFFYWGDALHAVRMGRWKLHFPHEYRTVGGLKRRGDGRPVRYRQAEIDLALFDLENDIGETTDVKDQHPEIVATIQKLADQMREELGDSAREMKGSGPRAPGQLEPGDKRFIVVEGVQTPAE